MKIECCFVFIMCWWMTLLNIIYEGLLLWLIQCSKYIWGIQISLIHNTFPQRILLNVQWLEKAYSMWRAKTQQNSYCFSQRSNQNNTEASVFTWTFVCNFKISSYESLIRIYYFWHAYKRPNIVMQSYPKA